MQANWSVSLKYVLISEGGYTNHPNDPGGPTNFGIIQSEYSKWIGRKATIADMKAMSRETAGQIYLAKYWTPMRCSELSSGLDYLLFDFAVNAGIGQAPKTFQRCLGVSPADGKLGPATMAAFADHASDPTALAKSFTEAKRAFYRSISTSKPKLAVFLKGWLNRCNETQAHALAMIANQPLPEYHSPVEANAKAYFPDVDIEMDPALANAIFVAGE